MADEKIAAPTLKVITGAKTPEQINSQQQKPAADGGTKGAAAADTNDFVFDPTIGTEKPAAGAEAGKDEKKGEEGQAPASTFNYSRFKDFVGKDDITEDDLFNAIDTREKKVKEATTNLAVVKEGKTRLSSDKQYQDWKGFSKAGDEDLVTASLAYDYSAEDGLPAKEAMDKAKERIKAEKERNPNYLEDTARALRRGLKQSMAEREQAVQTEIENASKDIEFVSPSAEFETKIKESQSKTVEFLGMKFSSDEKERSKLVTSAYLKPTEMTEALKDPEFYNQVCLLKKYSKQFKANIENRTSGKAKVLDKLPKAPSVGNGIRTVARDNGSTPAKFDGKGFLGR